MNILLVLDYYQPKLGYSEHYLAIEFARMGHKVIILTSDRFFPFPEYDSTVKRMLGSRIVEAGRKNNHGIEVVRKPVIFEGFCRTIFSGQKEVVNLFRPDIVLVNGTATYHTIILSLLKNKHNFILKTFDSNLPSEFELTDGLLKRLIYGTFRLCFSSLINRQVDAFIAVQDDTIPLMRKIYGVRKPIQLIDLGVDTHLFKYSALERKERRVELGIKDSDVVALYTGKIIEEKGVHVLLNAFNRIENECRSLHLVVVGSGPQDYISKITLKTKNTQRLHFVGIQSQNDLPSWYSMADFAVWPLQDTTAMNEAASCSLAFIANDKLGSRTRISNNNAVLYDRGDDGDLAKKMINLYAKTKERKQMGQRGRELMEKKLSWSRIAVEYLVGVN